ncbi:MULTISPECIES: hypothetical protein [unclassified Acidiphilium]|nr:MULTISPECIES: hypothetical protein [unclassified Acidiphilium]HQT84025.1 hypothetical protein [Acidiphilium rubrum]
MIVVGLRGVGKTVLLNEFDYMARDAACCTIVIEARELRPPPDLLAPPLRHVLLEFDRLDERFPRARFDRLTPREKHWVHAMARRTCQVLVGIGPVITAQALKLSFRVVNGCGIALFRRA